MRIGRVVAVHGLKGAVRVRLDNPESNALDELERVWLEIDGVPNEYRIADVSAAGHSGLKVTFEGVSTIEQAEELKGATILASSDELPAPSESEFYYHEIIGCSVVTTDGRELGSIAEVFATGANDVFVVRGEASEVLIPAIEDVVKSIDLDARRVIIDPIPGLLD
jgi:16S rRNA processing protein RimM